MYDEPTQELQALFEGVDFSKITSIELSGNSYGQEACQWISENVIAYCNNLKKVNFSDIFTTRLRQDLPQSLGYLINALEGKLIVEINLSYNAFGPDGVSMITDFLENCHTLKVLNLTNCGLGAIGGQMVSSALLNNRNLKLKEFYANRNRLENDGIKALSKVFRLQQCL